uniref:Uncharacterized protein n=1 Tax=Opuntia streptacantha TaxID=393608 RepID=A0A7C9EGC6_OPUST
MFPALGTCLLSLSHPLLETFQAEVMPTRSSDRTIRQLHTEGTFHILTKNGENLIIILKLLLFLIILFIVIVAGSRLPTEKLLAPLRLLPLRQRLIVLNRLYRRN